MAKKVQKKQPKKPKQPPRKQLPVDVQTFFRNGKRVDGYKRRKAGDKIEDDSKGA